MLPYFAWVRRTDQYATKAEEGLPTSDFRLPTSDFRLPTSDFRVQTSDFRLPTSDCCVVFLLFNSNFQSILIQIFVTDARQLSQVCSRGFAVSF